ncbi:MAG: peptidylprolyl isomerase [Polyangiales bacterium]
MTRSPLVFALASVALGCNLTAPPEPAPQVRREPPPAAPTRAQVNEAPTPTPTPRAPEQPVVPSGRRSADMIVNPTAPDPTSPDPLHGQFTLTQATAGLPPGRTLVAQIQTSMGTFSCELLSDRAPNTVANFVGLARGLRDFWDPVAARWVRRPFYDGSTFHRVIPNFMIQGGDILRSGRGGPGYEFADENVNGHDAPGLLCMANHGPNTNGAQFFITEEPKAHLDGSYSIFGRCTPTDLVQRIARVDRDPRDMPEQAVVIEHVTVTRR